MKIKHKKAKLLRKLQGAAEQYAVAKFGGFEPITDELINELETGSSWDRKTLIELRSMGMRYCRSRNSFFMPFRPI